MDRIQLLEFIGMLFSVTGAIFMAMSSKENTKNLFYAFIFYLMGNFCLFFVTANTGLVFIYIQTIFFALFSLKGILTFSNWKIFFPFFTLLILSLYFSLNLVSDKYQVTFFEIIFGLFSENQNSVIKLNYEELIYTIMALVGAFLMTFKNHNIREYSFILYFVADIGFTYIAFVNELYFFMIQTIFYFLTSIIAFVRNEGFLMRKINIRLKK